LKLVNQDIWAGYKELLKLADAKLPPKTAADILAMIIALERPYQVVDFLQAKLCQKYGELNEKAGVYVVDMENPEKSAAYFTEFANLLTQEWNGEFTFEPVEIPPEVVNENRNTLVPLWGKFVKECDA